MFANNENGLKAFEDKTRMFMEDLQETGVPFTMKRWAEYLGVTRATLYNILKRGEVWKVK